MFRTILIANRGEIACRIAATARRLGVRTIAVYTPDEAQARHVQTADEAWPLPCADAGDPRAAWLNGKALIEIARRSGAEAIHPGYGFLSENAVFAQACGEAGLVFIGPPAEAIAAMGSKAAAKALMTEAGVPLVPGYHGEAQDEATLTAEAERIGYPVLIKATAGGGGRGMRAVHQAADFAAALASCQRESQASFGDARVLIERLVERPRHIEVQVFADTQGHCVHLFERDCSIQRRHQKVLEEAPAPGLPAAVRARMGQAAIAAARSVGYVGAGTVEFICEADVADTSRFWFMEMNTRLQVEHPVTEAITGLDLVEWQLRVAAGEALPLRQEQITLRGHAIEARLCAEQPEQGFLPATGPITVWQPPPHGAFQIAPVRLDAGIGEGDAIGPHYDAMLAKLIVWGEDRATALRRLQQALDHLHVAGLPHNLAFLRRLARHRRWLHAELDTGLIAAEADALLHPEPICDLWVAAAWVAGQWLGAHASSAIAPGSSARADDMRPAGSVTPRTGWRDPWSASDAWQMNGARTTRHTLQSGDRLIDLAWTRSGSEHTLQVGEARARLVLHRHSDTQVSSTLTPTHLGPHPDGTTPTPTPPVEATTHRLHLYARGGARHAFCADWPQVHPLTVRERPPAASQTQDGGHARLTAPMPGRVVALLVEAGQHVKAGTPLAVTEAMKMEHTLCAPRDGTVAQLRCAVGDPVAEGDELLRLD
ncbi:biotin carboxylase N-terminal domain-containing protein [uncultured Aquabacterium sp.]|jgi:3-methylcrotonyl-CoA carboxylase alpha subunit|uniref:acetyl/propionyl/methylcrotonyl-CoA carboxylase subunit alpha n=1 Tax=uncultured Aquabacterium sp. TaxID=158753 RepID=UPI0026286459|nr:biotin carboxylase N-terminal domain-containing protein [uncultured Aquabacterium sp.]